MNQANMLQDDARTSAYYRAIVQNAALFREKIVLDVGAGSGVLTFFAAQAGASKVYAVEASNVASRMAKIVQEAARPGGKNAFLNGKIIVINDKLERIGDGMEKVDIIVSEPLGVFLIHERMCVCLFRLTIRTTY